MTVIANAFSYIDNLLAPIMPAGITAIQFLSVFLIVYAISVLTLSRVHILKENRPAQLIIALVTAYFTATSTFSVIFITKLFPGLGITTMMIIAFLAMLSLLLTEEKMKQGVKWAPLIMLISIGIIAYTTWSGMAGSMVIEGITLPQLTQDEWFTLIFIGIFIGVILLVSLTGKKKKKHNWFSSFIKALRGDYDWEHMGAGGNDED